MQVLGCIGLLPGRCYAGPRVYWAVTRALLCRFYRVYWAVTRVLLCRSYRVYWAVTRVLLCRSYRVHWAVTRALQSRSYLVYWAVTRALLCRSCIGLLPGCCYAGPRVLGDTKALLQYTCSVFWAVEL